MLINFKMNQKKLPSQAISGQACPQISCKVAKISFWNFSKNFLNMRKSFLNISENPLKIHFLWVKLIYYKSRWAKFSKFLVAAGVMEHDSGTSIDC